MDNEEACVLCVRQNTVGGPSSNGIYTVYRLGVKVTAQHFLALASRHVCLCAYLRSPVLARVSHLAGLLATRSSVVPVPNGDGVTTIAPPRCPEKTLY